MLGTPQDNTASDIVGADQARTDGEDRHTVPARLGGEVLAEPVQRRHAHHVGPNHRDRRETGSGGDVDYPSMAPGEHARQDRPAIQRPAQIDLQYSPPVVGIGGRQLSTGPN